jgi:hypothetical protein
MRTNKIKFITVLLFCFALTVLQAQQTVTTAGGNASGTGGSATYTIGQMAYITNSSNGVGSEWQGVQQAYEISVTTEINNTKSISLQYSAFPNPTTNIVRLKTEEINTDKLSYQLYDTNGKLIEDKILNNKETNVDMGQLEPATYILKVIRNLTVVKSFIIIKN